MFPTIGGAAILPTSAKHSKIVICGSKPVRSVSYEFRPSLKVGGAISKYYF